jgi:hypothetical protein
MKQILSLVGLLLITAGATAAPIVSNPGFEAPVLADGDFTPRDGAPIDWVMTAGTAGIWNPPTSGYNPDNPVSAPAAGIQVGFANNGSLCQDVGGTIQLGNTYTLTVAIGQRMDFPFPGYAIEIRATTSGNVKATSSAATPASGTFEIDMASFTAMGGDPDLGDALTICLNGSEVQTNFDEVTLTPVELQSFSID